MNLEELIQLQVLKRKSLMTGRGPMLERILEDAPDAPVRQMCAKVSAELYQELENICGALDLTKREFIESAVADAIERAHEHIEKAGGIPALFGAEDQGRL